VFSVPAVIAEAVEKWKADKEARLAVGGGVKDTEEEEEYIYAVRDEEVNLSVRAALFNSVSATAFIPFVSFCNVF